MSIARKALIALSTLRRIEVGSGCLSGGHTTKSTLTIDVPLHPFTVFMGILAATHRVPSQYSGTLLFSAPAPLFSREKVSCQSRSRKWLIRGCEFRRGWWLGGTLSRRDAAKPVSATMVARSSSIEEPEKSQRRIFRAKFINKFLPDRSAWRMLFWWT